MIEHKLLKEDRLLVVIPEGPLSREDFKSLAAEVDPVIESTGGLAGLLIDATEFAGWQDFKGLMSHFQFVKNHHRQIERIAILTNHSVVKFFPSMANHFIRAQLRQFGSPKQVEAMAWLSGVAEAEESAPINLRFLQNEDPPAIWIEVVGKVSREDYLRLLGPMESQFRDGNAVSVLVQLKGYDGMECGAMWEDVKFGFGHLKNLKRMAVVTETRWIEAMTRVLHPLFTAEIRPFDFDHEMEAWDWVIGES